MTRIHPAYEAHQRRRFMRPDAARYIRRDPAQFLGESHPNSLRVAVVKDCTFSVKGEYNALLAAKAWAAELKFCLALRRFSRKYREDQPRDDHGRWVYDGGRRRSETSERVLADAGNISDPLVTSDASPDPLVLGARYAQTRITIHPSALTGISTIDDTTKTLTNTLAKVVDVVERLPGMPPGVYGTAVHTAFAIAVRAQALPGIAYSDVERTFGARYGAKGSIRPDVILRNEIGDIIAIYDVKTGDAEIDAKRSAELRRRTGADAKVPIIELQVSHGVSRKALWVGRLSQYWSA